MFFFFFNYFYSKREPSTGPHSWHGLHQNLLTTLAYRKRIVSASVLWQERRDFLFIVSMGLARFYLLQPLCQASSNEDPMKRVSRSWEPRADKGEKMGCGDVSKREKGKNRRRKGWKKNGEK